MGLAYRHAKWHDVRVYFNESTMSGLLLRLNDNNTNITDTYITFTPNIVGCIQIGLYVVYLWRGFNNFIPVVLNYLTNDKANCSLMTLVN